MTTQEILAKLNIDTSDPEAVKGAVAALNALKTGENVWPPPPPPPPTDPPLPRPPKKGDPRDLKNRKARRGGHNKGGGGGQTLTSDHRIRGSIYHIGHDADESSATKDAGQSAGYDEVPFGGRESK